MTDVQKALEEALGKDQFAAANGIELIEVGAGHAATQMTVGPRHLNSVGLVHGGAVFTLASVALFAACNAAGKLAVGVNLNISYVKPVTSGTLRAEAREIGRSRRIATCTVRVTDEARQLVAAFQGTAYIKNDPFPPRDEA